MSLRPAVFSLAILLCVHGVAGDLLNYRGFFQEWYPGWSTLGPKLLDNCPEEYQYYLTESPELMAQFNATNSTAKSRYIHVLLACMLDNIDELDKAQIAVSNVILGVLPAILIFASSTCIELGLLAQCRPILTTLLAAASPGLSPLRRGEYYSEAQFLLTQPGAAAGRATRRIQPSKGIKAAIVSVIEYLLALAAIVNIIDNTWELSRRTISAYSPESAIQPILWATLALIGHFLEMFVMWLRVGCSEDLNPLPISRPEVVHEAQEHSKSMSVRVDSPHSKDKSRKRNFLRAWAHWVWYKELRICALHKEVKYTFRAETLLSRFFSWVCNKLIIVYIIWGTFFFSSILFVKPTDALLISLRYLASVVVSRLILQYELDGLSLNAHIPKWMEG